MKQTRLFIIAVLTLIYFLILPKEGAAMASGPLGFLCVFIYLVKFSKSA